jgi:hypothetical protein
MQKPVEGLSVLALSTTKNVLKKRRGEGLEKAIGAYETKTSTINKGGK